MCRPAKARVSATGAQVVEVKPDDKTDFADVKLHVLHVPALGYKVVWIGGAKRAGEQEESGVDGEGLRQLDHAGECNAARDGRQAVRLHYEPVREEDRISRRWLRARAAISSSSSRTTPKDYDAWNIDPGTLDVAADDDRACRFGGVGEDGGARRFASRATGRIRSSCRLISLSADGDEVNIDNEIDWHESHILLKAAFPLAASGPFATYEIPYGTIDRPTTRNNSWEKAQFEVPAHALGRSRRRQARPQPHQQHQVRLRRGRQPAAPHAAALAQVARSRCRHGPSSLPLRALSACGHVEGCDDRASRIRVQLPAHGRSDDGASPARCRRSTPLLRSRRRTWC